VSDGLKQDLIEIISDKQTYETLIAWLDAHNQECLVLLDKSSAGFIDRIGNALQASHEHNVLRKLRIQLEGLYQELQQEHGTPAKSDDPLGVP
jgi:hypothetical protein